MAKNVNDIKPDEDEREFDVDLDDEADDLEGDDEDKDEKEPTLEELKAEVARMQKALRKANKEAARTRIAGKNGTTARSTAGDAAGEQDDKSGEAEQWKVRAIRADTKAALLAAGFTGSPKAATRLTKLIDVDELDFEDDEIVGLDDQIDDLKEEFPNLFKADEEDETPVRRVRTESRVRGAQDSRGSRKPLTASERQAQALMGGGRR